MDLGSDPSSFMLSLQLGLSFRFPPDTSLSRVTVKFSIALMFTFWLLPCVRAAYVIAMRYLSLLPS